MSKTLASFTSYDFGSKELLADMEESWGSYFQELTQSEKLWLLSYVTGTICADASDNYDPDDVSDSITPVCERLGELSYGNQLGLASFLIANL